MIRLRTEDINWTLSHDKTKHLPEAPCLILILRPLRPATLSAISTSTSRDPKPLSARSAGAMSLPGSTVARQVTIHHRQLISRMLIQVRRCGRFNVAGIYLPSVTMVLWSKEVLHTLTPELPSLHAVAMATVQSDIFKPTKFGGKYTVTLIPGASLGDCCAHGESLN